MTNQLNEDIRRALERRNKIEQGILKTVDCINEILPEGDIEKNDNCKHIYDTLILAERTLQLALELLVMRTGIAKMRLKAGVLESGDKYETNTSMPQGVGISPLLAEFFLSPSKERE